MTCDDGGVWGWLREQRRLSLLRREERDRRRGYSGGRISSECAIYGDHMDCPGPMVAAVLPSMRCMCPCHRIENQLVSNRDPDPEDRDG